MNGLWIRLIYESFNGWNVLSFTYEAEPNYDSHNSYVYGYISENYFVVAAVPRVVCSSNEKPKDSTSARKNLSFIKHSITQQDILYQQKPRQNEKTTGN
jgi:hypothetical protein